MIERFSTCRIEPSKRLDFWNELVGSTYDGLVVDAPNRVNGYFPGNARLTRKQDDVAAFVTAFVTAARAMLEG